MKQRPGETNMWREKEEEQVERLEEPAYRRTLPSFSSKTAAAT